MNCDLCGKKTEKLFPVYIEGILMNVCEDCKKFGTLKKEIQKNTKKIRKQYDLSEEIIIPNFYEVIKENRMKKGLSTKKFAELLGISEKVLLKIERGEIKPDDKLRVKIEKILGVKLIEKIGDYKSFESKTNPLTIGDLIKKRK